LGFFTYPSAGEGSFQLNEWSVLQISSARSSSQHIVIQILTTTVEKFCWPPHSGTPRAFLYAEVPLEAVTNSVIPHPTDHCGYHQALSRAARFVLISLILTAASGRLLAKVHPVPLEKNADASTCLACHEDKTKGKSVHSAMATGCLSCHEIRVNKDVTRVKLTSAVPYKLCLTCHADKDATQIKGHVHQPASRDCLTCHNPHVSDNKNQLLKATSGNSKNDNLCLTCHNQGTMVPEKGSRHAALDMGCETCHVTHKTGPDLTTENQFHLTKATPALCLDCHDAKDANLIKAHQNQPFGSANCLQCHDPHQSAAPKLMAKFMHQPFADKNCEMCHAPAANGKVVLAQKDVKAICVTCHDEQAKKIESAKVQHPGAAGDCTDCHDPHAANSPGLPKPNAVAVCLNCHSEQAELGKKAHPHQPAFQQACSICHEPHGGDNPKLLRADNSNALCLECHGPDAKPEKKENSDLATIFGGKVRLPDDYFKRVVRLPLKYGIGHPVDRHPVADLSDPKFRKIKTPINCLACHQPHASSQPDLLVKDQVNNMAFCASCHEEYKR
jgi:predicted CXXCH cytochrome family protein